MTKEFEKLNQFLTIRKQYGPGKLLYETVCKYGQDGIAGVSLSEEIGYTDHRARRICKLLAEQKLVTLFVKVGNPIYVRQNLDTALHFETLQEKTEDDFNLLKVSAALKADDAADCFAYLLATGAMDNQIIKDRVIGNRWQYVKRLLLESGLVIEGPNPQTGLPCMFPAPQATPGKIHEFYSRVTGFLLTIKLI